MHDLVKEAWVIEEENLLDKTHWDPTKRAHVVNGAEAADPGVVAKAKSSLQSKSSDRQPPRSFRHIWPSARP